MSASVNGQEVFAPVAARLSAGTAALAEAGDPLEPVELVPARAPRARPTADGLVTHALHADRYGNVGLDAAHEDLAGSDLRLGRAATVNGQRALHATTFADVPAGGLLLYEDGYRVLSLAVNRGSGRSRRSACTSTTRS